MIVLAVLLALTVEPKPDCEMVRAYVAEHGKIAAYARALAQGYTPTQISRIRKACGV